MADAEAVDLLAGLRTGAWLDQQVFPPLTWTIPGIIPEGLSLLVGPPKVGKSWLTLDLALASSSGGRALGKIVVGPVRPVLYLALEDGDRRMQSRCRELLKGDPIPEELNYFTRIEAGTVLDTVRAWLETISNFADPLVILDTLGKVMPRTLPGETDYQRDYRVAGSLKRLCDDRPGMSLVVVHHDRKAASDDFVHSVSGTNGIAGAADSIILLSRPRTEGEAILSVTGRDVEEAEYAVTMAGGHWTLNGSDLIEAAKRAREARQRDRLGDDSAAILEFVDQYPEGVRAAQVCAAVGVKDAKTAGTYLARLAEKGRIVRLGHGLYGPANRVEGVEVLKGDFHTSTPSTRSDKACTVCRFALPTALVAAGATTHPTCEEPA